MRFHLDLPPDEFVDCFRAAVQRPSTFLHSTPGPQPDYVGQIDRNAIWLQEVGDGFQRWPRFQMGINLFQSVLSGTVRRAADGGTLLAVNYGRAIRIPKTIMTGLFILLAGFGAFATCTLPDGAGLGYHILIWLAVIYANSVCYFWIVDPIGMYLSDRQKNEMIQFVTERIFADRPAPVPMRQLDPAAG